MLQVMTMVMLLVLAIDYGVPCVQLMYTFFLLSDIGHELKILRISIPLFNQVILDFCLALHFSMADNPKILSFN
jgi:hypothetical protein